MLNQSQQTIIKEMEKDSVFHLFYSLPSCYFIFQFMTWTYISVLLSFHLRLLFALSISHSETREVREHRQENQSRLD